MSRYSVIFCAFFARVKNGNCSRKCRGHQIMTARSAARTTSPPKLSRANVVFLQKMLFSAAFPSGRHYFSHTKWLPKITDYRDAAALKKIVKVQHHSCLTFKIELLLKWWSCVDRSWTPRHWNHKTPHKTDLIEKHQFLFKCTTAVYPSSLPLLQLFQCSGLTKLLLKLITLPGKHALHQSNNDHCILGRNSSPCFGIYGQKSVFLITFVQFTTQDWSSSVQNCQNKKNKKKEASCAMARNERHQKNTQNTSATLPASFVTRQKFQPKKKKNIMDCVNGSFSIDKNLTCELYCPYQYHGQMSPYAYRLSRINTRTSKGQAGSRRQQTVKRTDKNINKLIDDDKARLREGERERERGREAGREREAEREREGGGGPHVHGTREGVPMCMYKNHCMFHFSQLCNSKKRNTSRAHKKRIIYSAW